MTLQRYVVKDRDNKVVVNVTADNLSLSSATDLWVCIGGETYKLSDGDGSITIGSATQFTLDIGMVTALSADDYYLTVIYFDGNYTNGYVLTAPRLCNLEPAEVIEDGC